MWISVIQLAYGDDEPIEARVERVAELVRYQRGHDLVVLPELWSAGGFDYRAWPERAQAVDGAVATAMSEAAAAAGVVLHAGSIVERPASGETGPEGKDLWNTSLVFDRDGSLVTTYRKIHRFGFGNGEPRFMEGGDQVRLMRVADFEDASNSVVAGLGTCYDLRFPEMFRAMLAGGAEAFIIPAAWPAARIGHWRALLRARAIENQALVVACNTAGTHAGHEMGGRSAVIGPSGDVLVEAGAQEQVLSVEVPRGVVSQTREDFPVLQDMRFGVAHTPGDATPSQQHH